MTPPSREKADRPAGNDRLRTFHLVSWLACTLGLALVAPLSYWAGLQTRLWFAARSGFFRAPLVAAIVFLGSALYLLLVYFLYQRQVVQGRKAGPVLIALFLLGTGVVGGLLLVLLFDALRLLLQAILRPQEVRFFFLRPQKISPLAREMQHYQTPPDAAEQYRLHLRVEADGRGLLVVNAATVLHLNQTATEYARLIVRGISEQEAVRTITGRYRIGPAQARADYLRLRDQILTLATTTDVAPELYLEAERAEPFSVETAAPYRVDIALTYRVDESGALDPEARRRVERELSTAEWQQALERLWHAGVPHVCFTGGEPTLRDDLVALVRYAEGLGMVSGLRSDGRRLGGSACLESLLMAGLDHLQITLTSHRPELHDRLIGRAGSWAETIAGLKNALAGDIYTVVHVIITPETAAGAAETVEYLASLGVPAVALTSPLRRASPEEQARMQAALDTAQAAAHRHGLTLTLDPAAPYSHVNPLEWEAGLAPEQVARQYLYLEPDGDALPAQGYNLVLGNILRDPWEAIWQNPARKRLGQQGT